MKEQLSVEQENKHERLKSFLQGNDLGYPSEQELETIVHIVLQEENWLANEGYKVERIKDGPIEKAFHDVWLKWNEPRAGGEQWARDSSGLIY